MDAINNKYVDDMIELHANADNASQDEVDAKRKEAEGTVFIYECMDVTFIHNTLVTWEHLKGSKGVEDTVWEETV